MTPAELRARETTARSSGRLLQDLTSRVTLECAAGVAVLAGVSAWLGGPSGAIGAAAGGAVGILNFRWIARAGAAMAPPSAVPASASAVGFLAGLRYLASFGALAGALVSGWAHPLAVMAGLTVLPASVIARGLAAARDDVDPR